MRLRTASQSNPSNHLVREKKGEKKTQKTETQGSLKKKKKKNTCTTVSTKSYTLSIGPILVPVDILDPVPLIPKSL